MELTSRLEALLMICLAGIALSLMTLSEDSVPEIRMFGFLSMVSLLLIVVLIAIISLTDENRLKDRALPLWSNLGYLIIIIGVGFSSNLVLGVLIIITGLTILLYALYYRERQRSDEAESDTEIRESGAEGEI